MSYTLKFLAKYKLIKKKKILAHSVAQHLQLLITMLALEFTQDQESTNNNPIGSKPVLIYTEKSGFISYYRQFSTKKKKINILKSIPPN